MMPKVSVLRTEPSPNLQSICEHLHRSIELLGGLDSFAGKGAKVLLKPNTGTVTHPEDARNTSPEIVEAMIVLLQEIGAGEIIVAESSLVGIDTMEAFEAMGIDEIARRNKTKLIDLKKKPFVTKKVPHPFVLSSIKVSSLIDEVDAIINLPKLKTIASLPVSLGLKNLKGLLPDSEKKRFHHTHLSRAIADLNQVVKPRLSIIDGIIASELYEPKETDILFAGSDVLAVDAVAARAIGFNPAEIEHMSLAAEAGVGIIDPNRIEVVGDSLDDTRLDLKKAPNSSEAYVSLFPEVTIVDGEACSGCVGSLYMNLTRARARGLLDNVSDLTFVMGANVKDIPAGDKILCIGNCTKHLEGEYFLPGCPFTSLEFSKMLEDHFVREEQDEHFV